MGQVTGSTPIFIFPIASNTEANIANRYSFINVMFMPIYWSPNGSTPTTDAAISIAHPPTYSDGDKTVTIDLKKTYKWASGAPVDANDVVFFIDLVKQAIKESPANYFRYTPGYFPDNVASAAATSKYTVTLHLTQAYNPEYYTHDQLSLLYALPSTSWNIASAGGPHLDYASPAKAAEIYNYLVKQGGILSGFATNPLWKDADGPFKIQAFSPSTGAYTLVPNSSYGGPQKARISELRVETFTTYQSELNEMINGTLDVGQVDPTELPEASRLKSAGYNVFGLPTYGFQAAFYNFKATAGKFGAIISQLYVRQALSYLEDQPAYIRGIFKDAASVAYGPIPSAPASPYAPASAKTPPYPYDVGKAKSLLTSHGWKVVTNGTTTCMKPGTAANECGAGIPSGTPLAFSWIYAAASPSITDESEAFASTAKQLGIKVSLTSKPSSYIIGNYDDAGVKSSEDSWQVIYFGGFDTQPDYPTTNTIFNSEGGFNFGGYDSSTANNLIQRSVHSAATGAVKDEAQYLATDPPVLFMPNPDNIYAVKSTIGGPSSSFLSLTQYQPVAWEWYLDAK